LLRWSWRREDDPPIHRVEDTVVEAVSHPYFSALLIGCPHRRYDGQRVKLFLVLDGEHFAWIVFAIGAKDVQFDGIERIVFVRHRSSSMRVPVRFQWFRLRRATRRSFPCSRPCRAALRASWSLQGIPRP